MTTERRLRIVLELTDASRDQYRALFAAIVAWNPRFAPRKLDRRTDDDAPDKPEPWSDARWADVAALAAGSEWRSWSLLGDDTAIAISRRVATTRVALVLVPPATEPFELMVDLLGRLPAGATPALAMAVDQESKQDGPLVGQGLEELRDVPPAFFLDRDRLAAIGGRAKLAEAEEVREVAGGVAVRVRPVFGKVSADARKRTKALAAALGLPRSFLGPAPAPREITIEQLPLVGGPTAALRGVWAASPDSAWAVGDRGLLARWDGKDWTALELFEEGEEPWLHGVGGIDELAWAVGEHGRVLAWNGTRWVEQTRASEETLYRVHAVSRELVVAVGDDAGHVVEWNGTSWRRVPSGTDQPLSGVASAGGEVWAVGDAGAIVRRVDGKWTAVSSPARDQLSCVSVVAPGDVWVAGVGSQVHHYVGGAWTSVPIGDSEYISGVLARAANDVWIVGNGCTIRRWNGEAWTTIHSGDREDLYDLCALDEQDVWTVGDDKLILRTRTR
jgi:hypothetical protein